MQYCCIIYICILSLCSAGASALAHQYEDEQVCAFRVLHVLHGATEKEIKTAYHKNMLLYHPDKNSNDDATSQSQRLNQSYEILGNHIQRSTYRCPSHLTHTLQDSLISFLPTSVSTILQQIAQCFGSTLPLDLIGELQSRIDHTENKSHL